MRHRSNLILLSALVLLILATGAQLWSQGRMVVSGITFTDGETLTHVSDVTVSVDLASVPAIQARDNATTATVTGARFGDVAICNVQGAMTNDVAITGCYVSAADTVTFRAVNPTAGAVDAAAINVKITILRVR